MIVAVWVEVGDATYVVDGWEHALFLLSAYLPSSERGGLNRGRCICRYGCTSSAMKSQFNVACKSWFNLPRHTRCRLSQRAIFVKGLVAEVWLE